MKRISWIDYENEDCKTLLVARAFIFVDDEKLTISATVALLRCGFFSDIAEVKRTSCIAFMGTHNPQLATRFLDLNKGILSLRPSLAVREDIAVFFCQVVRWFT